MTLLDILFPRRCIGCGKRGGYFCPDCRKTIRPILPSETICPVCERPAMAGITHPRCRTRHAPDGLTSFFHYDGVVRQAIKRLKYRFVSDSAQACISLIPETLWKTVPERDLLVPIPLHPARLKYRGFNQSTVLGMHIAQKLHIPLAPDILKRTKRTFPQAELQTKAERMRNVSGIFAASEEIATHAVLLFDDVFTTGATMRAAATALKKAGANTVWAVTLAR